MLLVDHDEAELGEGQEQRRAGADHHARGAVGHRAPGEAAHARGQVGVPHGRGGAEAVLEALQPLRGQCDLGQQHQRLAALRHALGHRLQVDLGLARAGDAVEQGDGEARAGDRLAQPGGGGGLVGRQGGAGAGEVERFEGPAGGDGDRGDQAGLGHGAHHPGAGAGLARQHGGGARAAIGQQGQHAGAGGRVARRGGVAAGQRGCGQVAHDRRRRDERVHPQRHGEHLALGGQGVAGDPVHEAAQCRGQRRRVEQGGHRLEPRVGDLARPERDAAGAGRRRGIRRRTSGRIGRGQRVPDHAHLGAAVQRHQYQVAGGQGHARRKGVVQRAGEGIGQQHAHAAQPGGHGARRTRRGLRPGPGGLEREGRGLATRPAWLYAPRRAHAPDDTMTVVGTRDGRAGGRPRCGPRARHRVSWHEVGRR